MKSPYHRIALTIAACFIFFGTVSLGCGGEEQIHIEETSEIETPDPNIGTRQQQMKKIAEICQGIAKAVTNGSVGTVKADAESLKEIMEIIATMPPSYDATRYGFYASDFQIRADMLINAAESGSAIETDAALKSLRVTCGVCHYNCNFPIDL